MRIGIDLGGTNIAGGLVSDDGKIIFKKSIPTPKENTEILLSAIITLIDALRASSDGAEITSIGIGIPGHADDKTGYAAYCNNIPLTNVHVTEYVTERTGLPCFLGNDANAAALAEVLFGSAKQYNTAVMITLGTGIGAGIVINNKVFTGANGAAGEIGHTCLYPDGLPCACGRRGCFELYGSATALIRQTKEAMEKNPQSLMHKLAKESGKVSGRTAFDAMKQGDAAAKAVIDQYTRYLATGVLDIINFLCPEAIIFGGGISKEGDVLLNPIRKIVNEEVYSSYNNSANIIAAELGNDAGIVGAAFFGE